MGTEGGGDRLGGDYPAFYGAGTIARDGDWDRLYDEQRQRDVQRGLVDEEGGFLYFAYPPPVAALYGPLSAIEYRWSYLLHTALMAVALAGAVRLARPYFQVIDRFPMAAYTVALGTYPLFRAVLGGQNTALTLLLLAAAARLDADDRQVAAGLAAGLMLYKPQFAAVVLGLLVLRARWKAIATSAIVAAGWWAWGAAYLGNSWLSEWWTQAVDFSSLDARVNSSNLVSLPGALDHRFGGAGAALGWTVAAVLLAALAMWWWRNRAVHPAVLYSVAACAAVLVLPRTLFYEAGLALPAAMIAFSSRHRVAMAWVVLTWVHAVWVGAGSPLLSVLVAAALFGAVKGRRGFEEGVSAAGSSRERPAIS